MKFGEEITPLAYPESAEFLISVIKTINSFLSVFEVHAVVMNQIL
jgi:hypothetical protein